MIRMTMNGHPVSVDEGATLLDAARFYSIPIPTLCAMEGLSAYGACRLCLVEIGTGRGPTRLVSSCTYPAEDGLVVRTASRRVVEARRLLIELYLARAPGSKVIQDLASEYAVNQQRFSQKHEDCILCGLCVRMCNEQMVSGAIGFRGRGQDRSIGTPYDERADTCRLCGGCIYVCPVCMSRCTITDTDRAVCGACQNLPTPCLDVAPLDEMSCTLSPCVVCEITKR